MPSQFLNVAASITDPHAFGAIYWATPAATTLSAATPAKCAGTTAAQGTSAQVTQATTNRLTYTGKAARQFLITATIGISAAATATTAQIHIYADGSLVTGSTISRYISTSDIGAMAITAVVALAQNGYVELWCQTDDGDDLTIQNGVMTMRSID
jgi:hypothetical protein